MGWMDDGITERNWRRIRCRKMTMTGSEGMWWDDSHRGSFQNDWTQASRVRPLSPPVRRRWSTYSTTYVCSYVRLYHVPLRTCLHTDTVDRFEQIKYSEYLSVWRRVFSLPETNFYCRKTTYRRSEDIKKFRKKLVPPVHATVIFLRNPHCFRRQNDVVDGHQVRRITSHLLLPPPIFYFFLFFELNFFFTRFIS
jgi:hypothetical protein